MTAPWADGTSNGPLPPPPLHPAGAPLCVCEAPLLYICALEGEVPSCQRKQAQGAQPPPGRGQERTTALGSFRFRHCGAEQNVNDRPQPATAAELICRRLASGTLA